MWKSISCNIKKENLNLLTFIGYLESEYAYETKTVETRQRIHNEIHNLCDQLYSEGKINKEFSEELSLFLKKYIEIY